MAGSGMDKAERAAMRDKLNAAISSCNAALEKLAAEDEEEGGGKGARAGRSAVALKAAGSGGDGDHDREVILDVAHKAGDGRTGTVAGIAAIHALGGQRGGPRE